MRAIKQGTILLCVVLLVSLCGCEHDRDDIGGIQVTPEMLESVSRSLAETTAEPTESQVTETMAVSTKATTTAATAVVTTAPVTTATVASTQTEAMTTVETVTDTPVATTVTTVLSTESEAPTESDTAEIPAIVYWTESGTVYHLSDSCSSLKNSTKILQGTVEEALLAEKERVCKKCS